MSDWEMAHGGSKRLADLDDALNVIERRSAEQDALVRVRTERDEALAVCTELVEQRDDALALVREMAEFLEKWQHTTLDPIYSDALQVAAKKMAGGR